MKSALAKIPFNLPTPMGHELEYIRTAILDHKHLSGDGYYTKLASEYLEQQFSIKKALLTTSCTDALEMSALLLNIQPGDEVIFPSFTFVSTLNAFVLRGAKPVYADIRPDTLNIDERQIEKLLTPKTKAVVLVHYAGVACEMDSIMKLSRAHGFAVIEDNAHALFGKYKGRWLGTFGSVATQSFHETKNFTCGEGGALLINDANWIERAEIIREKGTNRSRFFRGQVDKYSWVDFGSSFLMSDILAAFLFAQFEKAEQIQLRRKQIWTKYNLLLKNWAAQNHVGLPYVPADCSQAFHMFYLMMPTLKQRSKLIEHLKERQIMSVFHYLPLHLSDMGRKLGGEIYKLPITETVSDRILRLPFFNSMSDSDIERVAIAIQEFKF
jgi:dTDP-4-amino-4,6-dideoxygalactose transaminase